ncbi:MAG: family 10 glycosylhydrolase [Massilibacteroides sp.]|nr:family 10 glycosylhydrolase [Massilibacteroides sp.]
MRSWLWFFSLLILIPLRGWAIDPPKVEVRAVWLTTYSGLDWPRFPATGSTSRKAQQADLCEKLDRLAEANFNTIFIQARIRGDVMYKSSYERMSAVFSGVEGRWPGYDPLRFVIQECHKRGMECHAWFVTFPLGSVRNVRAQGKHSVVSQHRSLCLPFKSQWYLNPGLPATSDYLTTLVRELVATYDIDGIHFDYIRYPDKVTSFPDYSSYRRYGKGLKRDEWRRQNLNRLMARFYDEVKKIKPWVQVSCASLGKYHRLVEMPDVGWTAYESVCQDPAQWLAKGKLDMVVPMMYYRYTNYFPFLDDWVRHANGRLIVSGLGAYRMDEQEGDWALNDVTDQMDYQRYHGGSGSAFFRCQYVLNSPKKFYQELKESYYPYPALLPPLKWLNQDRPVSPGPIQVIEKDAELILTWTPSAEASTKRVTYNLYGTHTDSVDFNSPKDLLLEGILDTSVVLSIDTNQVQTFTFAVTASSRYHMESLPDTCTFYQYLPAVFRRLPDRMVFK